MAPSTARLLPALIFSLTGCAPEMPAPSVSPASLGLSVDGVPIRCGAPTTRLVGAEAQVEIALASGAELRADLDGAAIADRFDGDAVRRARLRLGEGTHRLAVAVRAGGAESTCGVDLARRSEVSAAAAALGAASETELRTTRSPETGAVADAVLSVPTAGGAPRERADDFVARFGHAFGAEPGTLRFRNERMLAGGWSVVEYAQWLRDVRAFRAGLTVTLDDAGRARLVHARLVPDDAPLEPHRLDLGAALERAQTLDIGTVLGAERVYHDVRAPAAAWWVAAVGASVLLDDATGEVRERRDNILADARVELSRAEPTDWGVLELGTAGALIGPTVALEGPAGGLPIPVDGQVSSPADETLWLHLSDATAYARDQHDVEGFADWSQGSSEMGWAARTPSASRLVAKDTPLQNAFYAPHHDAIFFGSDLRHPDIVCHELGHALHLHRARFAEVPRTFLEGLADAFMLGCEDAVDPSSDRYAIPGDASIGIDVLRDIAALENAVGDAIGDYDAFLATGQDEAALADPYALTFVLTHALYQMHETHSLAHRTVAAMVWEAMTWTDVATYAQLRDRWVATAVAWAESGRQGYSSEIVCAMAQAFRATNLDGEYGVGATCADDAEGVDLVCTSTHCPVCPDAEPSGAAVCPPESLEGDAPTCETADGRLTCLGSLAVSADGCAEGQGRHCWCTETEGGAAWDCSLAGACRTLPELARSYCPERLVGPGDAAATADPMDPMFTM